MNGFWERVAIAFRCFFSILFRGDIPSDIVQKSVQPAGPASHMPAAAQASVSRPKEMEHPASEAFDRAVQMLALLQRDRSEEHTSELQSRSDLVCRLLLEKKTNES